MEVLTNTKNENQMTENQQKAEKNTLKTKQQTQPIYTKDERTISKH